MANKVDRVGTFRGEIVECPLRMTKKTELPMFVIRLRATERYVEDQTELDLFVEHGVIETAEPQWVTWEEYDEVISSFMLLFNPEEGDTEFNEDNATLNYQQIVTAVGWDGVSFDDLANGTYDGTKVLFRVKEEKDPQYGPVTVAWLDHFDAPPQRELASIDGDAVSQLQRRMKIGKKKAAPKVASAPKPTTKKKVTKKKVTKKAPVPTAADPAPAVPAPSAPAPGETDVEFTKESAWESVYEAAGDDNADLVADAWIAAVAEVSETSEKDEADFDSNNWQKVHTIILKDLGVK